MIRESGSLNGRFNRLKKEIKMSFKIGDIQIDNSVVVAPMAGISALSFRVTVKRIRCWFSRLRND